MYKLYRTSYVLDGSPDDQIIVGEFANVRWALEVAKLLANKDNGGYMYHVHGDNDQPIQYTDGHCLHLNTKEFTGVSSGKLCNDCLTILTVYGE